MKSNTGKRRKYSIKDFGSGMGTNSTNGQGP
jgi:hypothetical protein